MQRESCGNQSDETAQAIVSTAVRQAALLREDLVDIINIVIEELVRRRYELPSFPSCGGKRNRMSLASPVG